MPKTNQPDLFPKKKNWPRLLVVNDPYPLRVYRELAQEIGFEESIMLLQLEYLIATSSTEEHDGDLWTYQSLSSLKVHFPWWSLPTISRILKRLETDHLIKVANYNRLGWDRTCWYALDREGINRRKSIQIDDTIFQNEKCNRANCAIGSAQNEKSNRANCAHGSAQFETTIPQTPTQTPTQTLTQTSSSSKVPREIPIQEEEGKTEKSLSNSFVEKLLKVGVFDYKVTEIEKLAFTNGWTETELTALLTKTQNDTTTPGALFIHRLRHSRPPSQVAYQPPAASPDPEVPDLDAVEIWVKVREGLKPYMSSIDFETWILAVGQLNVVFEENIFSIYSNNPSQKLFLEKCQERINWLLVEELGSVELEII